MTPDVTGAPTTTGARVSTTRPSALRCLAAATAFVGLAVVFWFWRILAPAPVSGPIGSLCGDLYTSYIPVLARAAQEFRGGQLPFWNPDQLAGVPTLPSWFAFGAFYPLNALFLVLPPHLALGWTACLHLALAGCGMYWLARTLTLSWPAAWMAATIYMLSLPLAAHPNLFIAMTLAPAVLASFVRLALQPRPGALAAAAALLALQFSSGGTQILVYTLYALGLLLPFTLTALPRQQRSWRAVVCLGLAAALAVGLVAVLLLPTTVSLELSTRATGSLTLAETVPFPTRTLAELGRELLDPTPGLPRLFFGWTALALALWGIIWPTRRAGWAGLVLILLAGTLLVLGPNTPAYAWYYRLPSGDWFRSPERAAMLISIGIALLAAHGLDHLRRRGWRVAVVILAVLPVFELFQATSNWLMPYPQVRSATAMAPPAALPVIESALGDGRIYIAQNWQDRFPFTEKLGTRQGVAVAQDYDGVTPAIYGDYFRALMGPDALVDPIFVGRYHPTFSTPLARRALDMLAVKLIVIAPGARASWVGRDNVAPPGTAPVLITNRGALERAFIVHQVESVADEAEALRRLADLRFDPASTVVVVAGEAMASGAVDPDEQVEVVTLAADFVSLRARLNRPGLLVLSDLAFPGWAARVDAAPAAIVRANGLFRGVYLDGGEHVIEFRYHQPRFVLGLWVTAFSIVVLAALILSAGVAPLFRNRPSRPQAP